MKTSRFFIGLALGVCLLAGWAGASAQGIDFDKASTQAKAPLPISGPGTQAPLPLDAAQRINERYVRHLEWQFEFAQHSWSWHFYSTILLFFIVLLIVAFGLWITYLQFQKDDAPQADGAGASSSAQSGQSAPGKPEQKKESDSSKTTMKLSAAGLELSSQIIGLFVLGFSLAFFYLYVKEVYPIQVLNLNQTNPQASAPKVQGSEPSSTEPAKAKP
jgi:hypothetical protein